MQPVAFCCKKFPHQMRPKVPKPQRHRARGVSMPPGMEQAALKRANELGISFSRYVQKLVEIDYAQKILSPPWREVAS